MMNKIFSAFKTSSSPPVSNHQEVKGKQGGRSWSKLFSNPFKFISKIFQKSPQKNTSNPSPKSATVIQINREVKEEKKSFKPSEKERDEKEESNLSESQIRSVDASALKIVSKEVKHTGESQTPSEEKGGLERNKGKEKESNLRESQTPSKEKGGLERDKGKEKESNLRESSTRSVDDALIVSKEVKHTVEDWKGKEKEGLNSLKSDISNLTEKQKIQSSHALREISTSMQAHVNAIGLQHEFMKKMVQDKKFFNKLPSEDRQKLTKWEQEISVYVKSCNIANEELENVFRDAKSPQEIQSKNTGELSELINDLGKYYQGHSYDDMIVKQNRLVFQGNAIESFLTKHKRNIDNFRQTVAMQRNFMFSPIAPAFQKYGRDEMLVREVSKHLPPNPVISAALNNLKAKVEWLNNEIRKNQYQEFVRKYPLPTVKELQDGKTKQSIKALQKFETPQDWSNLQNLVGGVFDFASKDEERFLKEIGSKEETYEIAQKLAIIDSKITIKNLNKLLKNKTSANEEMGNIRQKITRLNFYADHFPDLINEREIATLEDDAAKIS